MMCNGMLAGLVAITAPCAFVTPIGAAIIGAIAGVVVVYSSFFIEKIGIDDVAGAISVHGTCGAWGVISVGLFACGEYGAGFNGVPTPVIGLFYGGGLNQLVMQIIDLGALVTWALHSDVFLDEDQQPDYPDPPAKRNRAPRVGCDSNGCACLSRLRTCSRKVRGILASNH
jgi:ammonia channel protein AmtB